MEHLDLAVWLVGFWIANDITDHLMFMQGKEKLEGANAFCVWFYFIVAIMLWVW